MKKLTLDDLVPFQSYLPVQEKFLKSVIEEKKTRRVRLNDRMSGLFETRLSVWFQVQEMIRAEQIEQQEYLEEMLEVYNDLLPDDGELSMTLFIEIPNQNELRLFNKSIVSIENHVFLQYGEHQIQSYEPTDEDDKDEEYTQSVHYLRFPFTPEQRRDFVSYEGDIVLSVSHPNYQTQLILSAELVSSLQKELND
ncbi:MAG TPA: DUF3501 family protein [Bacillota bacterium]|nr:DUF3501 family protein [Bacillota bacterium]